MARTLDDKLAALDPAQRAAIEAEANRLHIEYLTLQELRKAKARFGQAPCCQAGRSGEV